MLKSKCQTCQEGGVECKKKSCNHWASWIFCVLWVTWHWTINVSLTQIHIVETQKWNGKKFSENMRKTVRITRCVSLNIPYQHHLHSVGYKFMYHSDCECLIVCFAMKRNASKSVSTKHGLHIIGKHSQVVWITFADLFCIPQPCELCGISFLSSWFYSSSVANKPGTAELSLFPHKYYVLESLELGCVCSNV